LSHPIANDRQRIFVKKTNVNKPSQVPLYYVVHPT
jgi:hypothetical protein